MAEVGVGVWSAMVKLWVDECGFWGIGSTRPCRSIRLLWSFQGRIRGGAVYDGRRCWSVERVVLK